MITITPIEWEETDSFKKMTFINAMCKDNSKKEDLEVFGKEK